MGISSITSRSRGLSTPSSFSVDTTAAPSQASPHDPWESPAALPPPISASHSGTASGRSKDEILPLSSSVASPSRRALPPSRHPELPSLARFSARARPFIRISSSRDSAGLGSGAGTYLSTWAGNARAKGWRQPAVCLPACGSSGLGSGAGTYLSTCAGNARANGSRRLVVVQFSGSGGSSGLSWVVERPAVSVATIVS